MGIGLIGVDVPQDSQALVERGAHGLGLARVLVIDNHDAPRRSRELGHGVEQVCQELLTLVRDDDDGELIDGSGKGGSHEREYPFAWTAFWPCGINNVSHGTQLL